MADAGRMDSLQAEHARLHAEIEAESARLAPDQARISELKRQKLRIKDELADHIHH